MRGYSVLRSMEWGINGGRLLTFQDQTTFKAVKQLRLGERFFKPRLKVTVALMFGTDCIAGLALVVG
jgi:hypothetical protein